MQFAIPNIKASKTFTGKSPNKKRDLTADKDNEEDEDGVKSVPSFSHMPYSVLSVSSLHSPSSPMSSPPSTPPPRSGHPDVKKLKRRINIEVNNEDYLNTRKAKIEKTTNDSMEDPKRMFLLSLLPDVNAMSDNQMRMFKRRVISLVEEILEEKSHSPT
ncbi:unnamed protein product [Parnassius apollo]|uniref:(apollo) hypothetical protein n=1 Tax=Parnassius apollo TaxID=110799 RepID=A0A8S3W6F7_PARAO|nr:unnamed protein product [Parnassius apollo]